MRKIFAIENIKTYSSSTFRVMLTLHFLFYILVVLSISRIEVSLGTFSVSRLYQFPYVWEFFSWVASWFNILLGVIVIVLISNEFRFYTFRQQIMNGLNEEHLLAGKIYMIFIIALYAFMLVILSVLISGNVAGQEGFTFSQFSGAGIVWVYFLQTFAYMILAMLFAVIFKNNGLAIVIFILYLFPGEVILRNLFFPSVQQYFPAKLISGLTPLPTVFQDQTASMKRMGLRLDGSMVADTTYNSAHEAGIALAYIVVFLAITYWLLKRKNY